MTGRDRGSHQLQMLQHLILLDPGCRKRSLVDVFKLTFAFFFFKYMKQQNCGAMCQFTVLAFQVRARDDEYKN